MGGINTNTVLCLQSFNADTPTTFTNEGLHAQAGAITRVGNTQHSTTWPIISGSSVLFDGTGDYLTHPSIGFSGNFTIDFYTIFTQLADWNVVLDQSSTTGWHIRKDYNDNKIKLWDSNLGTLASAAGFALDTLTHVAFVRNGDVLTLYIDGLYSASMAWAGDLYFVSRNLQIGRRYTNTSEDMKGCLQRLRIIYEAVWTDEFTVPSSFYTAEVPVTVTGVVGHVALGGQVSTVTQAVGPVIVVATTGHLQFSGKIYPNILDVSGSFPAFNGTGEFEITTMMEAAGKFPRFRGDIQLGATIAGSFPKFNGISELVHTWLADVSGKFPAFKGEANLDVTMFASFPGNSLRSKDLHHSKYMTY